MDHPSISMDRRLISMNDPSNSMDHQSIQMDDASISMNHRLISMNDASISMDHRLISMDDALISIDHRLISMREQLKSMNDSFESKNALFFLSGNGVISIGGGAIDNSDCPVSFGGLFLRMVYASIKKDPAPVTMNKFNLKAIL